VAIINPSMKWIARGVVECKWTPLANGDTGRFFDAPTLPDKTVQVFGTFGVGGSVNIEGSNDGGTTWHILNDSRGEGNALTLTVADTRTILENPGLIRPNVTAGDGTTSLTVIIVAESQKR
jgi:hypothetical protein